MKKITSVIMAFVVLITVFCVDASSAKYSSFSECIRGAGNVVLYDVTNDRTLYSVKPDERVSMASLTKLMTASVALRYASPNDVFTVGSEMNLVKPNSSLCVIYKGEQLTLYQLLCGLLIPSGNDAAYTIAVNVARKLKKNPAMSDTDAVAYFCSLMNSYAAEIGANSTHYVNPEGWDEAMQYSTANDLVKITKEALTYPVISEIVAMSQTTVTFVSGRRATWTNSNYLLARYSEYYYQYAVGVKTGTTDNAGYCLSAKGVKNGREFIAIVMCCPSEHDRFSTAALLLDLAITGRPLGDVSGNYIVEPADARLILRISVGLDPVTPDALFAGDIDGDGKLSSSDARTALRMSIGLEKLVCVE